MTDHPHVSASHRDTARSRATSTKAEEIVDVAPVLLWESSFPPGRTWFNTTWLEFTGRSLEAEANLGWLEAVHPDDREHVLDVCRRAADRQKGHRVEYRLRRSDGTYRWLLERATTRTDHAGSFIGHVGSCIDVTDLELTQQHLTQRARQQDAISRLGQSALCSSDLQGLMDETARVVAETLDAEFSAVFEAGPDGEAVRLRSGIGWSEEPAQPLTLRQLDPGCEAGYTLRSREPVIIADLRRETRFEPSPLLRKHGIVSGMNAIIAGESERPFGVVGVYTHQRRRFTRDYVNFLQSAANVLAAAIQREHRERSLRLSEARKSAVVDAALEGIVTFDKDGRIVDFSPAAERLFGYRRSDVVGRNAAQMIIPEPTRKKFHEHLQQLLSTAQGEASALRLEMPVLRSDGSEFLGEMAMTAIHPPAAEAFVAIHLRDVTARRRMEAELRRFKFLSDHAQDAYFIANQQMQLVYVNHEACQRLGYSHEVLLHKSVPEIDLFFDASRFDELFRRTERESVAPFESVHRRSDGTTFPVEISVTRLTFDEQDVLLAVVRDISRRKEADRERAELAAIVESSQDAIIGQSPEGIIRTWNSGAQRIYGYGRAKVIGRSFDMLLPEDRRPELAEVWRKLRRGRRVIAMETVHQTSDGREIHVALTLSPLRDEVGRLIGASAIARDITRRKQAEEELNRYRDRLEELVEERTQELELSHQQLRLTERMAALGTLSSGLGHDMGNLLLPIRLRLDAMAARGVPAEFRDDVASIESCIEHLQRLSNGLRLLARDPDDPGKSPTVIDLQEWWRNVESFMKNALPRHVVLEADIPADLPPVQVAAHRLTQAVANLVQNAGDAMRCRESGEVRVWADAIDEGHSVRLGVTDNGPGMTEDVRRRCMEPFFTTKTRELSTGLGLALVHGVVQKSGGRMETESEPNLKTTFTLIFPAPGPRRQPLTSRPLSKPRAVVTVSDGRVGGYAGSVLRALNFDVRIGGLRSDEEDVWVWVVDAGAISGEGVGSFMEVDPRRRVLLLGRPPDFDRPLTGVEIHAERVKPATILQSLRAMASDVHAARTAHHDGPTGRQTDPGSLRR